MTVLFVEGYCLLSMIFFTSIIGGYLHSLKLKCEFKNCKEEHKLPVMFRIIYIIGRSTVNGLNWKQQ